MASKLKGEHHFTFYYILAAFVVMLMLQDYLGSMGIGRVQTLPYSQFQDMLHQGKLDDLVVSNDRVEGTIKDAPKGQPDRFTTVRVDPALAQSLAADKVTFAGSPPPGWLQSALGWSCRSLSSGAFGHSWAVA